METRWLKFILSVLTLMMFMSVDSWAALGTSPRGLCQVSRNSKLAMDQRDGSRLSCLKQKKSELTVSQCLSVANSMEYSTNAEEARQTCLYDLNNKVTAKECLQITKAMEYPDSGDESRWECLRRFSKTMTPKQCRVFAKSMSYPANGQRAQQFCDSELN